MREEGTYTIEEVSNQTSKWVKNSCIWPCCETFRSLNFGSFWWGTIRVNFFMWSVYVVSVSKFTTTLQTCIVVFWPSFRFQVAPLSHSYVTVQVCYLMVCPFCVLDVLVSVVRLVFRDVKARVKIFWFLFVLVCYTNKNSLCIPLLF